MKKILAAGVLILALLSCAKNPAQSRRELADLGISYTSDAFVWCSKHGDAVAIGLFLASGMNPDASDANEKHALMEAAKAGHNNVVRLLIAGGADAAIRENDISPLVWATIGGHTETVKILLQIPNDFEHKRYTMLHNIWNNYISPLVWPTSEAPKEDVKNPLHRPIDLRQKHYAMLHAIWNNNIDIIHAFIISSTPEENQSLCDSSALVLAVRKGSMDVCKILLDNGANANAALAENTSEYITEKNTAEYISWAIFDLGDRPSGIFEEMDEMLFLSNLRCGSTPLIAATHYMSELEIMRYLLSLGADVNARDCCGRTALMEATIHGHSEKVALLLEKGADPDIVDSNGWTALGYAALGEKAEVAQALTRAAQDSIGTGRADLQTRSTTIQTSIIVGNILAEGADPNEICQGGSTPLRMAISGGNLKTVRTLLEKGAEVEDGNDFTPLMYAARIEEGVEVLKVLLQAGAGLNLQTDEGWTALIWAADSGMTEAVKILLESGADSTIKDNTGSTALSHAMDQEYKDIVKLLRAAEQGNE